MCLHLGKIGSCVFYVTHIHFILMKNILISKPSIRFIAIAILLLMCHLALTRFVYADIGFVANMDNVESEKINPRVYVELNTGKQYLMSGVGNKQDYEKAFAHFLMASEQNSPTALYFLGEMYSVGKGITQNQSRAKEYFKKAFELCSKAANDGDSSAMFNLGFMYETGTGVKQSGAKALEYYIKSAEAGSASAQTTLGSMYYAGITHNWREIAESIVFGCLLLIPIYVFTILRKSSNHKEGGKAGFIVMSFLGILAILLIGEGIKTGINGEGIPRDYNKAFFWTGKAAGQGNPYAQYHLGVLYLKGRGVAADSKAASNLFNTSCGKLDQKNSEKCFKYKKSIQ